MYFALGFLSEDLSVTPYAATVLPAEDLALFAKVRDTILALPDVSLGVGEDGNDIVLSCHMLARAASKVFGVPYVDGYFAKMFNHAWLVTPNRNIIDVYPVGMCGGPLLVSRTVAYYVYVRAEAVNVARGTFVKKSFRRSVSRIERALRKTIPI